MGHHRCVYRRVDTYLRMSVMMVTLYWIQTQSRDCLLLLNCTQLAAQDVSLFNLIFRPDNRNVACQVRLPILICTQLSIASHSRIVFIVQRQ